MKQIAMILACGAVAGGLALAELRTIPVTRATAAGMLDPSSPVWKTAPPVSLGLERTPPLYPTDQPAELEIAAVQVQLLRYSGHLYARLEWKDASRNASELAPAKRSWQGEHTVSQSEATDRFSDACAVMFPAATDASGLNPSLQMGDSAHPVQIFFWDATRGPAVLEAKGRETTHRTGRNFAAQSQWAEGKWTVTLELPDLPSGTPVAAAIWNGAQQDRDGRKYFSVWYKTQ